MLLHGKHRRAPLSSSSSSSSSSVMGQKTRQNAGKKEKRTCMKTSRGNFSDMISSSACFCASSVTGCNGNISITEITVISRAWSPRAPALVLHRFIDTYNIYNILYRLMDDMLPYLALVVDTCMIVHNTWSARAPNFCASHYI